MWVQHQLYRAVVNAAGKVADFLLPPRCGLCGEKIQQHDHLCAACVKDLTLVGDYSCDHCGIPFEIPMPKESLCGACMNDPPRYTKAMSAAAYGGAAKDLVLSLKHGKNFLAAPIMAHLMVSAWKRQNINIDDQDDVLVTAVPLHWRRLLSRRFNQSALLAKIFAQKSGYSYVPQLMTRPVYTSTQGGLGRKQRYENVKTAFDIHKKYRLSLQNKTVILIDDVMTTGATVQSCTKILTSYGVKTIYSVCFARVVPFITQNSRIV